jgi:hypothetical protein
VIQRRRTRVIFVLAAVALTNVLFMSQSLAWLPIIGGGGGSPPPPPPGSAVEPPLGGTVYEGSSLAGATPVYDANAQGDWYGRTNRASIASGLAKGTYRMLARIRSGAGSRADLLVDNEMTGTYRIGGTWNTVESIVHIESPSSTVGIGSWARTWSNNPIDVDWIHLSLAAPTLVTQANRLVQPTGETFRPRGVNVGDYIDPGTYIAPLEGAQIYAWGANWVRLGVHQEKWLNNCPVIQSGRQLSYPGAVLSAVNDLTSRGVYVVLTLMTVNRGEDPDCADEDGALHEMADTRSITFWQQLAGALKTNARVGFELFNEPHDIADQVWHSGGEVIYGRTVTGAKKSYQAVGMQGLYNVVRSTGARNLIVVSGQRWASDARVLLDWTIDGYGVVAATHSYCHECPWYAPALPSDIDTLNSPELRARYPFVLAETGWQYNTSGYNRQVIDWAEARGVGWGIHAWLQPLPNGYPDVYSILNSRDATLDVGGGTMVRPPSMNGTPVWNALAATRTARGYAALPMAEQ